MFVRCMTKNIRVREERDDMDNINKLLMVLLIVSYGNSGIAMESFEPEIELKETENKSSLSVPENTNNLVLQLKCLDKQSVEVNTQKAKLFPTLRTMMQDACLQTKVVDIPFTKDVVELLMQNASLFSSEKISTTMLQSFKLEEVEKFNAITSAADFLGLDLKITMENALSKLIVQKGFSSIKPTDIVSKSGCILLGITGHYEVIYNEFGPHTVHVYNRLTRELLREFIPNPSVISLFLSDKEVIASWYLFKKNIKQFYLTIWDLATGDESIIECADHYIHNLVAREHDLITQGVREIKIWDRKTKLCTTTIEFSGYYRLFAANEQYIAFNSNASKVLFIFDPISGKCQYQLSDDDTNKYPFYWATFKNDHLFSLHYCPKMMFKEWSLETGKCIKTFTPPGNYQIETSILNEYLHTKNTVNKDFFWGDFGIGFINYNYILNNSGISLFDFDKQEYIGTIKFVVNPSSRIYAINNEINIHQYDDGFWLGGGYTLHRLDINQHCSFRKFITNELSLSQAYVIMQLDIARANKSKIDLTVWSLKEIRSLLTIIKDRWGEPVSKVVEDEFRKYIKSSPAMF